MRNGHGEEESEYAVAYMIEHGFLSDEKLAESAVRSYNRRGYGSLRIRQELRHRGIEAEAAEAAMEDYEPDLTVMQKLLDKRLHGDLSDRKEVEKAVAALQRRGYRWPDIRRALRDYGAEPEEEE